MHKHKTRVPSDRYDEYMKSMEEYDMPMMEGKVIPVDAHGRRVGGTMEQQAEEIKEFYDLDTQGLKGGDN